MGDRAPLEPAGPIPTAPPGGPTADALLQAVVGISADAILVFDRHQRIVVYNQGAEAMFGWTRAEVLGGPHEFLLPERVRARHTALMEAFAAGPDGARLMGSSRPVVEGLRKSGELFMAEASISKVTVQGEICLSVCLRDVTQRLQEAAAARRRAEADHFFARMAQVLAAEQLNPKATQRALVDLPIPSFADWCVLVLAEEDGTLSRALVAHRDPKRAEGCRALGGQTLTLRRQEQARQHLRTGQTEVVNDAVPSQLVAQAHGASEGDLVEVLRPSAWVTVPLLGRDQPLGLLSLGASDGSRRYDAEDVALIEELARRAAVALDNARLYALARRASDARDRVLAVVAHDLRSPLSGIRLAALRLKSRLKADAEVERATLDLMGSATERMDRLIEDLIEATRLDAGKPVSLSLAPLDMAEVLRESAASHTDRSAQAGLELTLELPAALPSVMGDRGRLLQVLENLMGNAIKFTPRGGRVTLSASTEARGVRVQVADTGSGIPASDLPHVFDRHWQGDVADGRGAGLGLSISRSLVRAHGGQIGVDSVQGRGTTFWIVLPAHLP